MPTPCVHMKSWKTLVKSHRVACHKSLVLLHFPNSSPPVLDYFTFSFLSSNFLFLLHIITLCWWACSLFQRENRNRNESEENFHMLLCLSVHLHMYLCSAFPCLSWTNSLSLFPCLTPFLYGKVAKTSYMYSLSRILLPNPLECFLIRLLLLSIHWNWSCDRQQWPPCCKM